MRLLHTSDWHLGLRLINTPLGDHQRDFLHWLADLAHDRQVDAILVSGDVYDRPIPSVEAVGLLEAGLVELVHACPVVLISGNHDSARRLGFGGPLLEGAGLHLRSTIDDIGRAVEITDEAGATVLVYCVPYLEPEVTRVALGAEKSHEAVLMAAMDRVRVDIDERRAAAEERGAAPPRAVVMSHAFIRGGLVSTSERDVTVGGIADAPAAVFDGVDYVALGHLHGPQQITNAGGPLVRYSGTPLAYSFSEENHTKSVALVDISPDGRVSVELVATPVPRALRTITGDLTDLLADPELAAFEQHWVKAVITDPRRPDHTMERLRTRFPHAIELSFDPHLDGAPLQDVGRRIDPAGIDPVAVVVAFIEHVTGTPATDEEASLAAASVERVRIVEAAQ